MPIKFTRDPVISIPSSASNSAWVSIHNQVIYEGFRYDHTISSASANAGNTKLGCSGTVGSVTVGGKVYVRSSDENIVPSGVYVVVTSTAANITINHTYAGSITGWVTLLTDVTDYILTLYYNTLDISNVSTKIAEAQYYPAPDGSFQIDISPFYKTALSIVHQQWVSLNDEFEGHALGVATEFYESYSRTGAADVAFDDAITPAQTLVIVNHAQQYGATYGINLVEYINDAAAVQLQKFPRDFVEPTYFDGYPFALTFYWSEHLSAKNLEMLISAYTAGVQADNVYTLANFYRRASRFNFDAGLSSTIDYLTATIQEAISLTAYSETMRVRYFNCSSYRNPVYLKWIGRTGVWNFFLFGINQADAIQTKNGAEFGYFISNLNAATTDSDLLSKQSSNELTVGADSLDSNDLNGLRSLLDSPKVMMLTNPTTWQSDGDKWLTVKVNAGRYKIRDTKNNYGGFECTLSMPDNILVSN